MNDIESDRHLLDTAVTSLGILAIAVTSAAEVLAFLHRFGATTRTDGVFVAFALYSLVTVFAQILRTSAVPLVSGEGAPLTPAEFVTALTGMAVVIAILGFLGAGALGDVLGRSLEPEGRTLVASSLRLLAPAMALQLVGAGMAVIGATRRRFRAVGFGYVVANIVGLAAFFVAAPIVEERSLAWCVLVGSIVLVPCLLPATGTKVTMPPNFRGVLPASSLVLRSAAIPLAFVAIYPITLALAGSVPPGEITRFAFAYTVCSYLPGLTSVALSMTDVAVLSTSATSASARADIAVRSARWSSFAIAPVLALAATVGPDLFARLQSEGDAGDLGRLFVELAPWLLATVLLWTTLPALLAETRGQRTLRFVPAILVLHIVATLVGRALWGFDGVVVAMAVAPLAFAFVSWYLTEVTTAIPSMLWSMVQASALGAAVYAVAAALT
jgi:hypothetical protein